VQRKELNITKRISRSLEESLAALEVDKDLQALLGASFVRIYCAVKKAESAKLATMEEKARRKWLIDWY
jgi:glutamine synthetase